MIFAKLCFRKAELEVMLGRSDYSEESMEAAKSGPFLILSIIPLSHSFNLSLSGCFPKSSNIHKATTDFLKSGMGVHYAQFLFYP